MYHTTGLSREEISGLCVMAWQAAAETGKGAWPPSLGLYKSVLVTLSYLRRNRVQAEIAESFGVSQPTISRAISAIVPLLEKTLTGIAPTAEDLDPQHQFVVDGTLLPCWSWTSAPGLYSGKHKTTGMNVQVACTLDGEIAWISDPIEGSRHDMHCIGESGVLSGPTPGLWIADKGYIGSGMITPIRKPAHRDLQDWEKEFSTAVNRIRYVVERAIANFKTWRIMHTDYRRPLSTFAQTISVVVGLYFYRMSAE
jgi:DDE superfamily endonuclease/Helix-turn-helix of DDE superfamily endonuclease